MISKGESSNLTWNVVSATKISIEPGIGTVGLTGSQRIFPGQNTTYTLTATNEFGSVHAKKSYMSRNLRHRHLLHQRLLHRTSSTSTSSSRLQHRRLLHRCHPKRFQLQSNSHQPMEQYSTIQPQERPLSGQLFQVQQTIQWKSMHLTQTLIRGYRNQPDQT